MANAYPALRRPSAGVPRPADFPAVPRGEPWKPGPWPTMPMPANDNWPKADKNFKKFLKRFPLGLGLGLVVLDELLFPGSNLPLPDPGPGWRLVLDCGGPRSDLIAATWVCGVPRTLTGIPHDFAYFQGYPQIAIYWHKVAVHTNGEIIYEMSQYWDRVGAPTPQEVPLPWPHISPLPGPAVVPSPWSPAVVPWPHVDPMRVPPNSPQPVPNPIPWRDLPGRRPNPWTPERPEWGNEPWRSPDESPVPGQRPAPGTAPVPAPGPVPDWELYPNPGPISPQTPTQPNGRPGQDATIPRRPRRGEKERKISAYGKSGGRAFALRIVNLVSEGVDLMDAFYWALPDYRTSGKHNATQRAEQLWKHWDEVDMQQAMENVIANELQDRFYGRLGRAAADLAISTGRPVGYGAGPAL